MTDDDTKAVLEKIKERCVARGGHLSWTGATNRFGHPILSVRLAGSQKGLSIRRLLWEEVNGPLGDKAKLRRKCSDPTCVLPAHYEVGRGGKPPGATCKPTLAMQEAATYAQANGLAITSAAARAEVSYGRMRTYLKKMGITLARGYGGRPTKNKD